MERKTGSLNRSFESSLQQSENVIFCKRVPFSVKELWKIMTSKNILNFKVWEATHWGALASSTPEVSVGVDPVECVGS